jgi:hypothetical protein
MARESTFASTETTSRRLPRDTAMSTIASAAVTAPAMKIVTKACSGGMPVVAMDQPRRTATTAAAIALPTVRAMAFTPVATPVSPPSTSLTTSAGKAPYARLM